MLGVWLGCWLSLYIYIAKPVFYFKIDGLCSVTTAIAMHTDYIHSHRSGTVVVWCTRTGACWLAVVVVTEVLSL